MLQSYRLTKSLLCYSKFASRNNIIRSLNSVVNSKNNIINRNANNINGDVIIIGGGHAGCEAATASARAGAKTILVTQKIDTIGEMSCNPSIGGIGKGHLVKEIDALDGVMGRAIDKAGIHFKMLNMKKGPAVRGPRAQADRDLYKKEMQSIMLSYDNLYIVEASVEDLLIDNNSIKGIITQDGREVLANQVVITTGTFLRGRIHLGRESFAAGRQMRQSDELEAPSIGLAQTLERFKFPLSRLKTGTPPRLRGASIDWESLERQPSDNPIQPFSFLNINNNEIIHKNRLIECAKTYTNSVTHDIVMRNKHLLPDYEGGEGDGVGPRYCPSLFKKCQRFPEKDRHIVWLEPEGLDTDLVYPNGISGPYPIEVQLEIVRSIPGLEECDIEKPGYDVEYDYVQPTSLTNTLESKVIKGLYLAGQICGTTGYEEAGAQGIIAGANAGLAALNMPPFTLGRDDGYIGVLVDDLITRGTNEPYRMFTSRAEYRLSLRQDNADIRLTRKGVEAGIVGTERALALADRETDIDYSMKVLTDFKLSRSNWTAYGDKEIRMSKGDGSHKTAVDVLSMPDVSLHRIQEIIRDEGNKRDDVALRNFSVSSLVFDTVEATAKYSKYLGRQELEMDRWRRSKVVKLPVDIEYSHTVFPSFSSEELEKFNEFRPDTLHAASQIPGITPHALIYLHNHIIKRRHLRQNRSEDTETKVTNSTTSVSL